MEGIACRTLLESHSLEDNKEFIFRGNLYAGSKVLFLMKWELSFHVLCYPLFLFFYPPQSNYCIDKKLLLVLKTEDVIGALYSEVKL